MAPGLAGFVNVLMMMVSSIFARSLRASRLSAPAVRTFATIMRGLLRRVITALNVSRLARVVGL